MDLSIVIINWRSVDYLRECLQSIFALTLGIEFEVLVADNASYDGCDRLLRDSFPEVRFLQLEDNFGFAKANNRAAATAKGRYIVYLNPDTRILTNAMAGMTRFLDTHRGHDAVGCRIEAPDGSIQRTCARTFPTPLRQFNALAMLDRLFPRSPMFSSVELNYWDHRDSRDIDCLSGACMMVRRETVERLGGFDERLFMYGEDVDLCYRIRQGGGAIHYLASERVLHYGAGSSPPGKATAQARVAVMQRHANHFFMRKHFGRRRAAVFRLAVLTGSAVRLTATAVLLPISVLRPGRVPIAASTMGKYAGLLSWAVGLRKTRVSRV